MDTTDIATPTHLGPYMLGPNSENQGIYTGDARELAKAIPDESVDLIFTDPVYDRIDDYAWLAETAARVLRSAGALLCWQGIKWLPETTFFLGEFLVYRWAYVLTHSNATVGTIKGPVYNHWTPLLYYDRGNSSPKRVRDYMDVPLKAGRMANHRWNKSNKAIEYWLDAFAPMGSLILDPFTGGGTVPAVCKQLGRRWLAFEIDPTTAEAARERVRLTQPPLFVPEPQQLELNIE